MQRIGIVPPLHYQLTCHSDDAGKAEEGCSYDEQSSAVYVKVSTHHERERELDEGLNRAQPSAVSCVDTEYLRDSGFTVPPQLVLEIVVLEYTIGAHWMSSAITHFVPGSSLNPKMQNCWNNPPTTHNQASSPPSGGGPASASAAEPSGNSA